MSEYRARLFGLRAWLFFFLALILVGIIFPLYVSLDSERNAILLERDTFSKKMMESGQAEIESKVKEIGDMTALLNTHLKEPGIAEFLDKVFSASSLVSLRSIQIEKKKDYAQITLGGMAKTREMLVEFSKALESIPTFSSIDLPVSSLAKSRDIAFTLNLRSK